MLKLIETLLERFRARNEQEEIDIGMFRVPVPDYDERAFREALINALSHRDYILLSDVHVQMTDNELIILNPGGFVEGVTIDNLLMAPPRSRNPRLTDALKRVGLVEAHGTGRGRSYTLSARVYRAEGRTTAYVRQAGFEPIQQRQMVLNLAKAKERIKRSEVMELCHIDEDQAYKLLKKLVNEGELA